MSVAGRWLLFFALATPVVLACAGGPAPEEAPPPPPPPAKEWVSLFSARAAPGTLWKGLRPGMARSAALAVDPTVSDASVYTDPEFPALRFTVAFDPLTDTVAALSVDLDAADAEAKLSAAWGPAALVTPRAGGTRAMWWDPAGGTRAELLPVAGSTRTLRLTAYTPADRLLGPSGADWAFLTGGTVFGKTVDEIALAYADQLRVSAPGGATAERVYARIEGERPKPGKDQEFWLALPPTEYADGPTRARLGFARDGRCQSLRVAVDTGGQLAAKDAVHAVLATKFGNAGEAIEEDGAALTLYQSGPRVTAQYDEVAQEVWIRVEMGAQLGHKPRPKAEQRPRPRPGSGAMEGKPRPRPPTRPQ